jgi:serine/threonine protein kinase
MRNQPERALADLPTTAWTPPLPSEAKEADELEGAPSLPPMVSLPASDLPPPVRAAGAAAEGSQPAAPADDTFPPVGSRLDDFELIRVLGRGAFATVYLARHLSLGRDVALKVTAERGGEARTLASLEHPNIVQVFWELTDVERDLRLLCMQYVPGTTLERVIRFLAGRDPRSWSGQAILEAVAAEVSGPISFDASGLNERQQLAACDFVEAACWLGARLAEALAYAHRHGVRHRDIKPANILINLYGRPLLADFNLALDRKRLADDEPLGGTLGYMAPEHLDAFNPAVDLSAEAVDERSDIYSLGVVLFELLTGQLPFPHLPRGVGRGEALREMSAERRAGAPSPRALRPDLPPPLDRVVRRCLQPPPLDRYASASELAEALEGCRQLRQAEKHMPAAGPITRALQVHTRPMGLLLTLTPHLLAAAVNVTYTSLRIAADLAPPQQEILNQLTIGYNLAVFSATLLIAVRLSLPIRRLSRRLAGDQPPTAAEVRAVRRHALAFPRWGLVLSCLGWLPGGVILPLLLSLCGGAIPAHVYLHFMVSFTIAGLVAVTYNVFANQFLVLRVIYPRLWCDARHLRQEAREELRPVDRQVKVLQLLAGLIPLVGGALLLLGGGAELAESFSYRLWVLALIVLGMAGFGLSVWIGSRIARTVTALTGREAACG